MNIFKNFKKTYIIAEIGVNHNGDISLAKKLIEEAKKSGANAVKFQTFKADTLSTINSPKVDYQLRTSDPLESHYEMLKKLELAYDDHFILKNFCQRIEIDFLSTPYDLNSAKFLFEELDIKFFKTASADLIDLPLHNYISKTKKPSIISVGMATLEEIQETIQIYKKSKNNQICLLHCVSNYPCSDKSLNMNTIHTLKENFNLPVGYSDHSLGFEASLISISMGACIIEKHFTLDKKLPGPDHLASSTPTEFKTLVKAVRRAEIMMGSFEKKCRSEELQMSKVSRKSIFLNSNVKKGEILKMNTIILKRPGIGLKPNLIKNILGKKFNKNLKKEHMLSLNDLND